MPVKPSARDIGKRVRVVIQESHFDGCVGELVAVHDPTTRLRRCDVKLDGGDTVFCFAPDELMKIDQYQPSPSS